MNSIAREIKEKSGYVAIDFHEELARAEATGHCEIQYSLPDESQLFIGSERFRAPEILFQPSHLTPSGGGSGGIEANIGVHQLVHRCIQSVAAAESGLRKTLCRNVVLGGGSTMFDGMLERLTKELRILSLEYTAEAPQERKFSAWIGGSILASLDAFEGSWVARREFEELGIAAFHGFDT